MRLKSLLSVAALSAFVLLGLNIATRAAVHVEWDCLEQSADGDCLTVPTLKTLYIFGFIDDETAVSIAMIDGLVPSSEKFPDVILNSQGGYTDAAMWIGRILRRRSATVVGQDFFFPERMPECYSACSLIAAGAVERRLVHVGLHQGGRKKRIKGLTYERIPSVPADRLAWVQYLGEMGMPYRVVEIIDATPNSEMTNFYLDLDDKFEEQDIVQLGFRTQKPSKNELDFLRKIKADETDHIDSLKKLASKGDFSAAHKVAQSYFYGTNGVEDDISEALNWYEKAGNLGSLASYHMLGVMHANGYKGLPVNRELAIKYYRLAALKGFGSSQNNLGWSYYKGEGIEKNIYEAIYWLSRAVEQGDPFSYGSLGTVMFETEQFIKDDAEIYKWLKMAVDGLPEGTAKEGDKKIFEKLVARMTPEQIADGEKRIATWKPLKPGAKMVDKDDY